MTGQQAFPSFEDVPSFEDGKDPEALRTIGEVCAGLRIRQHVLRYWEEQFPMLRPVKRSGGRRYYRPADVALIATIDRLVHREGYTLKGARKALEGMARAEAQPRRAVPEPDPGPQPVADSARVAADLATLQSVRDRLASALADS